MGHSSIKVTFDTYGHLFPGRGKEASDRYEKAMRHAREKSKVDGSNLVAIEGAEKGGSVQPIEKAWLRGVDLNHRPLGYERIGLLLSSSIYGTSGVVGKRK
jgi:hypothetical protein